MILTPHWLLSHWFKVDDIFAIPGHQDYIFLYFIVHNYSFWWSVEYPRVLKMCQAKFDEFKILEKRKCSNFKCAQVNFFKTYPMLLPMSQAQFNKFKVAAKNKYYIFKCTRGEMLRRYHRLLKLCQAKFNKFKTYHDNISISN